MTKEEEKYTTLDTEQCKWWVNHLFNIAKEKACNSHNFSDGEEIQAAQDKIIKALEQQENNGIVAFIKPSQNTTTLRQLMQPTSDDCVSRQAILDIINSYYGYNANDIRPEMCQKVKSLPSITPTHEMCKDCEHWKDSDGAFRRGIGAESKCPINIIEVYEGNFYCGRFKKRGSEND